MPYFEVKSPRRGAKLRLDSPFFVIGRGERIPIFHDDPSISREHAAVVIRKNGVRVRDLGSKNGVLLNGKPIGRYAEVALAPGDTVKIGATSLVLRDGEPPVSVKPAVERPAAEKPAKPDAERVAALAARRGAETILAGPDAEVRRPGAPEAVEPAASPSKGSHTMAVAAAASIGAALRAPEDPADAAEAAREGPSAPLSAPAGATDPAPVSSASAEPVSATSSAPSRPSAVANPAADAPRTPAPTPETGSADAPTGRLVPDDAGSEPTAVMERTKVLDHPGALLPSGSETFRARPFEIGPEIPTGDRLRPVDEAAGSHPARPHEPLLVPGSDETHSTLGEAEPPASLMASDEDDDALPVEFE